jgi:hypothetical protein
MKTFNFKAIIAIILFMFFGTKNLNAQIGTITVPYGINNLTDCNIQGTWEVHTLGSCTGTPCDNGTFNVPAQTAWQITQFTTCTPSDQAECIIITITVIGTTTLGTPIVINSSTATGGSVLIGNIVFGCTATTTYYIIDTANFFIAN